MLINNGTYAVTDAHCHPTDLDQTQETYDTVALGGIASMATIPEDQAKVASLAKERGWISSGSTHGVRIRKGVKNVACFGESIFSSALDLLHCAMKIENVDEDRSSCFSRKDTIHGFPTDTHYWTPLRQSKPTTPISFSLPLNPALHPAINLY
jgi:hypothetical protein